MKNIIITLILTLSVFSIYENKAFAQQNNPYENEVLAPQPQQYEPPTPPEYNPPIPPDLDGLVFFVNIFTPGGGTYYISKQKLSEKITDILNSVTLTENIEKIDDETISFSVTYVNGDVFNDVQCSVDFSSIATPIDSQIHLLNCQSNKVVFEKKDIQIPYLEVVKLNEDELVFIPGPSHLNIRKRENSFIDK